LKADSFSNFLERWGNANPPTARPRESESVLEWQGRFREKLEDLRGPLPERLPLEVEELEREELEDHTRLLVRIRVSEVSDLPAYILVPRGIPESQTRPGILASHGHVERGMEHIAGVEEGPRSYGLWAVRAGYVTICPAWWGWPGRDGHSELVGGDRDKCNVIAMAAAMYGANLTSLHIQDGTAALDALAARPDVDADRLAVIGNSYGGRTAMWLAAFDDRVKACVAAGAMNTFRERSLKLSSCGIQCLPGLLQYGDVPEIFSLAAPRALQLQAGEGDSLITPADRDTMVETVSAAYKSLGAEDRFEGVLHPHGHTLSWEHAAVFLERQL
jgi:dienelactone hydrolase